MASSPDVRLSSISSENLYSKKFAENADARDPLRFFRNRFRFPKVPSTSTTMRSGERCVYLCGNSLGLQPVSTKGYINDFLEKWSNEGVEGHFTQPRQWVDIDELVNGSMAKIVGAKTNEVVVMNSLTANLHFLLVTFYRPTKQRFKIVIESKAFPSDIYAVKSQLRFHGFDESALVQLEPRNGESTLRVEDFERYLDENGSDVALVLVSGIQYYTGQCFELDRIVRAGHRNGCVVGADLAHAVGNVELNLHDWNVDFAVWCTYKYMNSGPGNIGGAFVHERHDDFVRSQSTRRLEGWWGHRPSDRFEMKPRFESARGVRGFQLSNPPVFCVEALRASLDIFEAAGGMSELRKKSEILTRYLERLLQMRLSENVSILTPKESHRRGCQLSLVFRGVNGKRVHETIAREGVICDFREPDVMRIAPAPLYNSFLDVFNFVRILEKALLQVKDESNVGGFRSRL